MKRDMELMRKILFEIEDKYNAGEGSIRELNIKNYEMPVVAEHCDILYQVGLVNLYNPRESDSGLISFFVGNLTNAGYDFLELIRNEEIWQKTAQEVKKKKLPQTIETISKIAGIFIGAAINQMLDK